MKFLLSILFLSFSSHLIGQVYLNPDANIDDRVEDLLSKMTLAEKIGQMTQAEKGSVEASGLEHITSYYLGSVLSGGGNAPNPNTVDGWIVMYNAMQAKAKSTRLGIPLLYGIDAVHGHNNLVGAVIFPHNIGLGCTRNPDLVKEISRITALEVRATGPEWTFSPCVTVPQNIFWGRTYEGFSENTDLVDSLGKASILGYQSEVLGTENYVLACAKHFVGDGGTQNGIDQGNTVITESELRRIHLPPYLSAIEAGVGTIMASFNSWNGVKVHGRKDLLTDILKTELGFEGFVISDWKGVDQVNSNFKEAIKKSINAGVDMAMQPDNYITYINHLTELVNEGNVALDRIDDAVRRILRIKFQMGLFEKPPVTNALKDTVGCLSHREVARQAVRESLILLKNDGILPLPKENTKILVAGFKGNDIGAMCGGWSITWQGQYGAITNGTTILEGLRNKVGNQNVIFTQNPNYVPDADYAVVVVGEPPYAESRGDIFPVGPNKFSLSQEDRVMINAVMTKGIPTVIILLSGRPLHIEVELISANAFIAAWLPGSEGGSGIADVLLGDYFPKGKLSFTWPKTYDDVPMSVMAYNYGKESLFNYGFGLTYDATSSPENNSLEYNFKAYPNPFTESILITIGEPIIAEVIVVDAMGRVVTMDRMKGRTHILNTNNIDPGVYVLILKNSNKLFTKRLIKL